MQIYISTLTWIYITLIYYTNLSFSYTFKMSDTVLSQLQLLYLPKFRKWTGREYNDCNAKPTILLVFTD